MKKLLFSLSFLLLATGCSDSDGGATGSPDGRPGPAVSGFVQLMQKNSFQCAVGPCPGYVAAIYRDLGNGMADTCSGTYIGDNRVLTNSHCLEASQRRAGAGCSNIAIQLPAFDGQPQETFGCQSVENVAKEDPVGIQPDWAILNIAGATSRPPASISFTPVFDNTSVDLLKLDFDKTRQPTIARVYRTTCVANSAHTLSNASAGPGTVISDISDCIHSLKYGNSGSGMYRSGALVGVFSFMYPIEDPTRLVPIKLSFPDLLQKYGGGTNLHCIPIRGRILPETCAFSKPEYSELAKAYSMLKEQRAHSSYQQTQQALLQNYQSVGYRELRMGNTRTNTLNRLHWVGTGSVVDPVRANLIREVITQAYPYLPVCIEPGSLAHFQQSLLARIPLGPTVPGPVLKPERLSSVSPTTVNFQKLPDGSGYMMGFLNNVFPEDSYYTVLGNNPNFGFSVPFCQ